MCVFSLGYIWPAVSFEIPDLPEVPDGNLPAPVAQSLISQKEKLSRTVSSSSSTASSCSSHHLPLSKTSRYCIDSAESYCCCDDSTIVTQLDYDHRAVDLNLFSVRHSSEAQKS